MWKLKKWKCQKSLKGEKSKSKKVESWKSQKVEKVKKSNVENDRYNLQPLSHIEIPYLRCEYKIRVYYIDHVFENKNLMSLPIRQHKVCNHAWV